MVSRHRIGKNGRGTQYRVTGKYTSWTETVYPERVPKDPPVACTDCYDRGYIERPWPDPDDPWAVERTACDCPRGKEWRP